MEFPAKGSHCPACMVLLSALGCGLLAACNFPSDNGATVGSKGLWVANGTNVVEYNTSQLSAGTGATAPHVSINSAVFGTPQGVAFDPNGNLWVLDDVGNLAAINEAGGAKSFSIAVFSPSQLATGSPTPFSFIIGDATTLNAPEGCDACVARVRPPGRTLDRG